MYETIVTSDGRLALVLRKPKPEPNKSETHERVYADPIIIDYLSEDEEKESPSTVIIINTVDGCTEHR